MSLTNETLLKSGVKVYTWGTGGETLVTGIDEWKFT